MRRETHLERLQAAQAQTIVDAARFWALDRPDAVAFACIDDNGSLARPLTFGDLWSEAHRIAGGLEKTIRPGDRVVLITRAEPAFVAALLGCFLAGVIPAPAPAPRRGGKHERWVAIARDCGAVAALTNDDLRPGIQTEGLRALALETMEGPKVEPQREPVPEDLAFLQYTSGSTGNPKGVRITHAAIWHNQAVIRTCFGHDEGVRLVGWLPNYHDMGLIGNLLQPLYAGGLSAILAPAAFLQRPMRWLKAISALRAHTSGGPNFAYELCLRALASSKPEGLDLSCWKVAFNGAEPVRPATLRAFERAFAAYGFDPAAMYPCYGLAEATLMVTGAQKGKGRRIRRFSRKALAQGVIAEPANEADAIESVSCGAPPAGIRVQIDAYAGRVGEIVVESPSQGDGYWSGHEGAFCNGAVRTGDLGAIADGELYVLGRLKDVIIQYGANIHAADVENAARSCALVAVNGAAAFGVADADGVEQVVLAVEIERRFLQRPSTQLIAEVRAAIAEQAGIALGGVLTLKPGALLKTSSGKVRRRETRAAWLEGALAGLVAEDAGALALARDYRAREGERAA